VSDVVACTSCGQKNRLKPDPTGSPKCGKCGTALPWLVDAGSAGFRAEVSSALPVVVDFWAPWCGPCRMVAPVLEQLARENAGRLKVVKVNTDENQELAAQFQARSIPLLVVMKGGREVDRIVGALPKPALAARLAPHLAG
jgi:thioredoxin 2